MKQVFSHSWNLNSQEAVKLQEELKEKIVLKKDFSKVKRVAGADISFSKKSDKVYAAVIIFSFPKLEVLEEQCAIGSLSFPYIPGLLTFREGPLLLETFKKIRVEPDVIIFDGQGIAHPRSLGLATHMGILLDKPTIGCAKSRLIGAYQEPARERGSYSLLRVETAKAPLDFARDRQKKTERRKEKQRREARRIKTEEEIIGAVLRTKENVSPLFISPGHKIDLKSSLGIVLKCSGGYRLPEPTRQAHLLVNRLRVENRE